MAGIVGHQHIIICYTDACDHQIHVGKRFSHFPQIGFHTRENFSRLLVESDDPQGIQKEPDFCQIFLNLR